MRKFDHWLEMVIEDARLVDGGVAEYASLTGRLLPGFHQSPTGISV